MRDIGCEQLYKLLNIVNDRRKGGETIITVKERGGNNYYGERKGGGDNYYGNKTSRCKF